MHDGGITILYIKVEYEPVRPDLFGDTFIFVRNGLDSRNYFTFRGI